MAGFAAIGTSRMNIPQLVPQWIEQSRQPLGIMNVFQRDLSCQRILGHRIYRQMPLERISPPCFLSFNLPSPNTLRPVESITK